YLFLLYFTSCNEHTSKIETTGNNELSFFSEVEDLENISSRGFGNIFFLQGDSIKVSITSSTNTAEQNYLYTYGADGIFRGIPGYRFPTDDTYITNLVATWPAEASGDGYFVSDQRKLENHRKGDWLVAVATESGIMATDAPVPLYFEHQNCLLEFELVGQNAEGLNINELVIQLDFGSDSVACWAYCENENRRASLYLPAGTNLSSYEGYIIGSILGEISDRYSILLSDLNVTLEAGKRYLVTLTPRGYNLEAYLIIGGWINETETGIAVPFHKPVEADDGDYVIQTPAQLITRSYLMRHYYDSTTIPWPTLDYTITDDFEMTSDYAALYIPVPRSLFTGNIYYKGKVVEQIPYEGDQVLELFE
ncbi:MAG: fimbrillin family protein, partial [Odoribacter sp.]|nr:fimbrillin family protein [Odoribacter sp.]